MSRSRRTYRSTRSRSDAFDGTTDLKQAMDHYLQLVKKATRMSWTRQEISLNMSASQEKDPEAGGNKNTVDKTKYILDIGRTWRRVTGHHIFGVGVQHALKDRSPQFGTCYPGFAGGIQNVEGVEGVKVNGKGVGALDDITIVGRTATFKIYIPREPFVEGKEIMCSSFTIKVEMRHGSIDVSRDQIEMPKNEVIADPDIECTVTDIKEVDGASVTYTPPVFSLPNRSLLSKDDVCFCSGGMVNTKHGSKCVEDVQVGDVVQTKVGFQRVLKVTSSNAVDHPICTVSNGLQLTHKHPVFIDDKWVHPKTVAFETKQLYSGTLTNFVIDASPDDKECHTIIVNGVLCATLGCGIQEIKMLDPRMDAKYGSGFWERYITS